MTLVFSKSHEPSVSANTAAIKAVDPACVICASLFAGKDTMEIWVNETKAEVMVRVVSLDTNFVATLAPPLVKLLTNQEMSTTSRR